MVAFAVLLAVTCVVGLVLVGLTGTGGTALDLDVLDTFHRGRTPERSTAWSVITDAGASAFLIPAAVLLGLVWRVRRGDWLALQLLLGAYAGGGLLHAVAKPIVGRERPGGDVAFTPETGLSFPSGHASQASAFWVALGLLVLTATARWAWRIATAALVAGVVVLVATSRLYLGAHWVTDVAAGTIVGTTWAGVWWASLVRGDRS